MTANTGSKPVNGHFLDQGYAAYSSGAENPYAPSSPEAASWQRGFNAAELDAQDAYDWGDNE